MIYCLSYSEFLLDFPEYLVLHDIIYLYKKYRRTFPLPALLSHIPVELFWILAASLPYKIFPLLKVMI